MPRTVSNVLPGVCPDCHVGRLVLRRNRERRGSEWFYGCSENASTGCRGQISAYPGTKRPMGTPANRTTRAARRDAHRAFDPIWQLGCMTRVEAYEWLQRTLRLPTWTEPHIGDLDHRQCNALVYHARHYLKRRRPPTPREATDARHTGS